MMGILIRSLMYCQVFSRQTYIRVNLQIILYSLSYDFSIKCEGCLLMYVCRSKVKLSSPQMSRVIFFILIVFTQLQQVLETDILNFKIVNILTSNSLAMVQHRLFELLVIRYLLFFSLFFFFFFNFRCFFGRPFETPK